MNIQPVILAGGSGYRIWPLSQKINPKQFIKYFDNLSSFQETIIRNAHLGKPLVLANIVNKRILLKQLEEINADVDIIFEPKQKNTAICALVASYYAKRNGFDLITLIPSDHHIEDQLNYEQDIRIAINAAAKYNFSIIGIKPINCNSNFGYVKVIDEIEKNLYLASGFMEKPNKSIVEKLNIEEYFWNSGIYFFNIDYIFDLANKFIPETTLTLSNLIVKYIFNKNIIELKPCVYNNLNSISFDEAFSVNLSSMTMVKAKFKWCDLGSWEALLNIQKKDNDQNNISGKVVTHNVTNSYISSDAKQTLAVNLKDTIVVLKNGQLSIANKNGTEVIKEMLINLEKA